MTYTEHDLQAFRDRVYVTTGARLTLTDAAVELDRIRGVYGVLIDDPEAQAAMIRQHTLGTDPATMRPVIRETRMADDYFTRQDP